MKLLVVEGESLSSIYSPSSLVSSLGIENLLGEYSWRGISMSFVDIGVCMDACHAGEAIVARGRPVAGVVHACLPKC